MHLPGLCVFLTLAHLVFDKKSRLRVEYEPKYRFTLQISETTGSFSATIHFPAVGKKKKIRLRVRVPSYYSIARKSKYSSLVNSYSYLLIDKIRARLVAKD